MEVLRELLVDLGINSAFGVIGRTHGTTLRPHWTRSRHPIAALRNMADTYALSARSAKSRSAMEVLIPIIPLRKARVAHAAHPCLQCDENAVQSSVPG